MRIYVFAMTLVCASCATTTQITLRHPTKQLDSPEYQEDQGVCRTYANSAAPMQMTPGHGPQRDLQSWSFYFYRCMHDKGWEVVDQDGNSVSPTPHVAGTQVQSSDAILPP
ncbi:MAG: hypothetical protein LBV36_00310 [Chromatiales bacterium]|jgi:hypothetical protein|nr:hypothetical protein [Chromatiales bacterium]